MTLACLWQSRTRFTSCPWYLSVLTPSSILLGQNLVVGPMLGRLVSFKALKQGCWLLREGSFRHSLEQSCMMASFITCKFLIRLLEPSIDWRRRTSLASGLITLAVMLNTSLPFTYRTLLFPIHTVLVSVTAGYVFREVRLGRMRERELTLVFQQSKAGETIPLHSIVHCDDEAEECPSWYGT
jgi:hypothetical protein